MLNVNLDVIRNIIFNAKIIGTWRIKKFSGKSFTISPVKLQPLISFVPMLWIVGMSNEHDILMAGAPNRNKRQLRVIF